MNAIGYYALLSIAFSIGLLLWNSALCLTGRKRADKLKQLKLWMPIILFFAIVVLPIAFVYSKIEGFDFRRAELIIISFFISFFIGAVVGVLIYK